METYREFFRLCVNNYEKTDECILDRIPKAYHNLYLLMAEEIMQTFPEEEWREIRFVRWSPQDGLTARCSMKVMNIIRRYERLLPHICVFCGKPKIKSFDYAGYFGVCADCLDKLHPTITQGYTIDNFNNPVKMTCQEWNPDFTRIDEVDLNYIYDMLEKI